MSASRFPSSPSQVGVRCARDAVGEETRNDPPRESKNEKQPPHPESFPLVRGKEPRVAGEEPAHSLPPLRVGHSNTGPPHRVPCSEPRHRPLRTQVVAARGRCARRRTASTIGSKCTGRVLFKPSTGEDALAQGSARFQRDGAPIRGAAHRSWQTGAALMLPTLSARRVPPRQYRRWARLHLPAVSV